MDKLAITSLEELSNSQQKEICGGASFAYRVGQALRFLWIDITNGPTLGPVLAATDLAATEAQN